MSGFYSKDGIARKSVKQDWETPAWFYKVLDDKRHFTMDAAASDKNAKAPKHLTEEDDALNTSWGGETVFVNPPYGRTLKLWVKKGEMESANADVTMLIPARTDTSYYHDFIKDKADVDFLRGRLKFEVDGVPGDPAPFPSMVVHWERKMWLDDVDLTGKRCYISGPMTGYPDWNRQAFSELELDLMERGASKVFNPAKDAPKEGDDVLEHWQYMLVCLHTLTGYSTKKGVPVNDWDYLVLLPEWEKSSGAKMEVSVAKSCGVDILRKGDGSEHHPGD